MNHPVTRRSFVHALGTATAVGAAFGSAAPAARPVPAPRPASPGEAPLVTAGMADHRPSYLFFNAQESAFIEAACERLIPADETGPGALEACVPNYLDRQLGGAWGAGERLYRSGPWSTGTPSQGYQLPFTPAELFQTALRAINAELDSQGKIFADLPIDQQEEYLRSLEAGGEDLGGVPSEIFFEMLLQMVIEGYFSDPIYGGNKDMAAWKMIGFPGAYANYYEAIDRHGVKFERLPTSIGEDGHGHVHLDPNIPSSL